MNNKEIILAALKHKAVPRIPVIQLSSGLWEYTRSNMTIEDFIHLPPERNAEFMIHFNRLLNFDIIWTAAGCNNLLLKALGAEATFNKLGFASSIDSRRLRAPEEIDKLKEESIENSREIQGLLEATRILARAGGEDYLIGVSQWGPFTLAGLLFGLEEFMKLCMRDMESAHHVLDKTSSLVLKYLQLFTEAGAELVCQSEPTSSGDVISPRMFKSLAAPYLKRNNGEMAKRAAARMTHICGDTGRILEEINEIDADLYSVDFKVDLLAAKEKLAGKTALAGNIDPVRIMLEASAEEVKTQALRCCEEASGDRGFVLMPGCDIPAAAPLENIQAMVAAAHQFSNSK